MRVCLSHSICLYVCLSIGLCPGLLRNAPVFIGAKMKLLTFVIHLNATRWHGAIKKMQSTPARSPQPDYVNNIWESIVGWWNFSGGESGGGEVPYRFTNRWEENSDEYRYGCYFWLHLAPTPTTTRKGVAYLELATLKTTLHHPGAPLCLNVTIFCRRNLIQNTNTCCCQSDTRCSIIQFTDIQPWIPYASKRWWHRLSCNP